MAQIFSSSFEEVGKPADWDAATVGAGCTFDWDNSDIARPYGGGSEIIKIIAATGEQCFSARDEGSGDNPYYFRAYFYFSDLAGLGNSERRRIVHLKDNANNGAIRIYIGKDGSGNPQLEATIYESTGYQNASDEAISTGRWYRIEAKYNASADNWQLRVNGSLWDNGSLGDTHRNDIRYVNVGCDNNESVTGAITYYIDLVAADDADWV